MPVHYETCPASWGDECNCPYGLERQSDEQLVAALDAACDYHGPVDERLRRFRAALSLAQTKENDDD